MLPSAPRPPAYARAFTATGLFRDERVLALHDRDLSASAPRPPFVITRSLAAGTSLQLFAAFRGRTTA